MPRASHDCVGRVVGSGELLLRRVMASCELLSWARCGLIRVVASGKSPVVSNEENRLLIV
jgi:hypothetical protein